MSLVRNKDKRTGVTYVYESESYWDKEKQQPRARRRLIGKIDEETGEIVPTDGRGRKRQKQTEENRPVTEAGDSQNYEALLREKDCRIDQLTAENQKLRKEKERLLKELRRILAGYDTPQA